MAREFSVVVGINASRAIAGGRQFKTGADQVNRSNRAMQRSTAGTTRRMTAMITTMGRVRGVASLMFAGFLGVGGINAVIRTLSQFQTAMSSVAALVSAQNPRSLSASMSVLTERAREMGATTLFTATQAAEGMKFLTLAGFEVSETFAAIEPALNLAAAGMLSLGQSADILSNIMAAFSVDAREAESVADALAFTAARTNTNVQQLGEAMKFVGPVAGTLGVNVEETSVALGILGNAGLQASLAGTSLRRTMSGLLNPSKEAEAIFAKLGVTQEFLVSTMQGPKGLVNLVEIFAEKGLSAAQAFTLFGQRGAPGLLSLINQKDKLAQLTDELDEAAGAAARMAKIMADNLGGDARIALSALQEAILVLGDSGLTDWLRSVVQGFTGFIRVLAGVETPLEDFTAAMLTGINIGQTWMENLKFIKAAAIALTIYLLRNTIKAIALTGTNLLAAAAKATIFGRSLVATRRGAVAAAAGLKTFRAALASTGIGIALIATGLLVDWLMNMGEATEATADFRQELRTLGDEAEAAAVRFDGLAAAGRAHEIVEQQKRIREMADSIKELTSRQEENKTTLEGLDAARQRAAEAQARFNALDKASAGNVRKHSAATREWTAAQREAREARQALADIEALGGDAQIKLAADVEAGTSAYRKQAQLLSDMVAVNNGVADSIEQLRKRREEEAEQVEKANVLHLKAFGISEEEKKALIALLDKYASNEKKMRDMIEARELLEKAQNANIEALKDDGVHTEDLTRAKENLEFAIRKALIAQTAFEKATRDSAEKTEDLADKMHDLKNNTGGTAALTREFTRAIRDSALEVMASTLTLEEYQKRVALLREEYEHAKGQICNNNKKIRECTDDTAKEMTAIWDQAMRNIQDAFADAFRNIGSGFDDFAESILDAFKDMLAQMAAQAAISNIFGKGNGFFTDFFGGVSGAFGGGGGGGGAGGGLVGSAVSGAATGGQSGGVIGSLFGSGGMLSGVGSAMQNALGALTSAATAFGHGALSFVTGGGGAAAAANGSTITYGTASAAQNAAVANPGSFTAGGVVAGAGIGALTGAVADAILGGRGDPTRNAIFSAIGGAIGSLFSPIGAVIGGAIGSFVDNILGGAKKLESAIVELSVSGDSIYAVQEEIMSKQRSFFRGRSFTTTRKNISGEFNSLETEFANFVETLRSVAEEVGGFTDFIDSFEFARDIDIKGANAEAQIERAIEDLFQAATDAFLNDVEGLPARMELTLRSFSDNLEEFVKALELTLAIENLFDIDLVAAASDQIAASQVGIVESYQQSLAAYREVIAEYDGSIESLEALTTATAIFTQIQLDLISVYEMLGRELGDLFQGSAQSIRESLMSDEELYQTRRDQIDDLVARASQTTDPEELRRLADEINRLGLDAFSLLDEDQRRALGPEFIEFFEGLDSLFGDQIAEGIGGVVQDQADLDLEVATRMEEAAQAIIDAARALEEEAIRRRDERELRREIHR